MATMQVLKNHIASDMHRSDLTTQIDYAVTSAVRHYNKERLWFNEGRSETTLSSSQVFYASPTDMIEMDSVLVTINGSKTPLGPMTYGEMDELDTGKYFGQPDYWSYYQDNFRFYPVPDSAYVVTLSYHKSLDEPSASGSNAWTSTAYDLIRYRAEWDIYKHYLRNPEMAQMVKESESEELVTVVKESTKKASIGFLRKSGW